MENVDASHAEASATTTNGGTKDRHDDYADPAGPVTARRGRRDAAGGSAVRLIDVARIAGVSQKTVSNVINDFPYVSATTRSRVLAAIDRLGYKPNLSARNLARGRTGIIALVIPELTNPYFSRLTELALAEAERRSFAVLIEQTGGLRERETQAISNQRSRLVDGIIMSVSALDAQELDERTGSTPLVLLGERIFDGPVDHVVGENVAAARAVTEHLIALGRRRIAVIGMERALEPGLVSLRRKGYMEALAAHDIENDARLIIEVPSLNREAGYAAAQCLIDAGEFDALVCFNDLLAMGAIKALTDRGVSVPDDVAVAGFDNTDEGRYAVPSLTSIDWDVPAIVHNAVERLDARINAGLDSEPTDIVVAHRLIVRSSTHAGAA